MKLAQQQCLLFYNGMASVFHGLFENSNEYSAYSIRVIYIDDAEMVDFSSDSKTAGQALDSKEWIAKNHALDTFRLASLRFIPKISVHTALCNCDEEMVITYYRGLYSSDDVLTCHKVFDGEFKVFFLRIEHMAIDTIPAMIDTLFIMAKAQWRDSFLDADNLGKGLVSDTLPFRPLEGDANMMIQSRPDYLNESRYFSLVTSIAAQYHERSKSVGKIAIANQRSMKAAIALTDIKFSHSNLRQLRKLLEMTRDDFAMLVANDSVYGIGASKHAQTIFRITGHMEWEMCDGTNVPILRFKSGNYYVPLAIEMSDWYIEKSIKTLGEGCTDQVKIIISYARKIGHGALLIFANDVFSEVSRLCSKKMGFLLKKKIDLVKDCQKKSGRVLSSLSRIDGAVFIDTSGMCHGFGVILDGEAIVDGNPARGSRYNSAKNYVAQWDIGSHVVAAVYSDDGTLDILASEP